MCVFLISPVPIAEPLTSELIDTPVFHNLAPRPIKYRVPSLVVMCSKGVKLKDVNFGDTFLKLLSLIRINYYLTNVI